jgi:hypothetical protein
MQVEMEREKLAVVHSTFSLSSWASAIENVMAMCHRTDPYLSVVGECSSDSWYY